MIFAIVVSVFAGCSKNVEYTGRTDIKSGDISVVSFNVAAPWGNLNQGTSGQRVKRFAAYMNAIGADSIGTQEMNADWLEKLEKLMPQYKSYGIERGGDDSEKKSEMNAVFWLKDKYNCIDMGTFWLSETPLDESRYKNAGCNRICSYVVLENKETGAQYVHMNTHLDNASEDAREYGAGVVMEKMEVIREQHPDADFVLTGDFNDVKGSAPYKIAAEKLNDCSAANRDNIKSTYTDWGAIADSGEPIDFVFTQGEPVDYATLDDMTSGFVSDHYGLLATMNFE